MDLRWNKVDYAFCIVGPQPPPRHGVSAVNERISVLAEDLGFSPFLVDTRPDSLAKSLPVRIARARRIWRALLDVRRYAESCRRPFYLSLSGGLGLIWEALLAFQARRFGSSLVVHHHSFRYLDRFYIPMQILVWAVGRGALHVALSESMKQRLKERYGGIGDVLVLSNACFVGAPIVTSSIDRGGRPSIVGLIGNLSAEKGLRDFLQLADTSWKRGLPWKFVLAGPVQEMDRCAIEKQLAELPNLEYRGPLYGEAKTAFLEEIDVLVFPTRYRHEAEPLVVLEALKYACPVIAFGRGCIPEMLVGGAGATIPVGADFVTIALSILEVWRKEGADFDSRRVSAQQRFADLYASSNSAISKLFEFLKS